MTAFLKERIRRPTPPRKPSRAPWMAILCFALAVVALVIAITDEGLRLFRVLQVLTLTGVGVSYLLSWRNRRESSDNQKVQVSGTQRDASREVDA